VPALPEHAAPLLGRWSLAAWRGVDAAGDAVSHGGPHPRGELIYLPSGRMAVQIQFDGREPLGSLELDAGTIEQQAAAYRTYNAYAGFFTVPEPGVVVHRLELGIHPDQTGMEKRRSYRLSADELELELETQRVGRGVRRASSILTWRLEESF
jgi:hypothetical protein